MARAAEVIARLSMSIYEPLHVFRRATHRTRSHSFASVVSPGLSVGSAVMITIFPALSISMRAICTPAAVTALTALVTSCCRNVDGVRAMVRKIAYRSLQIVQAVAGRPDRAGLL